MKNRLLLVAFTSLLALAAAAQQHENVAKGFAADKVYQFNGLDQINMFNLALNVGIPIGPAFHVNGPLSYGITLRYSGNNWHNHSRAENTMSPDGHIRTTYYYASIPYGYEPDASLNWNAGIGWNVGFGRLTPPPTDPSLAWTYETGDGAKHNFFDTLHELNTNETSAPGRDAYGQSFVQYTSDNSYLRMRVVTEGSISYRDIEFPDGMIHRFPYDGGEVMSIRDRFGNQVTYTTTFDDWGGTKQLAISDGYRTSYVHYKLVSLPPLQYTPGAVYLITSVDLPAFKPAGATTAPRAVYTFHYGVDANGAISYAPGAADGTAQISRRLPENGNLDCQISPAAQAPILTSVTLPDGSSYEMHYDLGDGGASYSASYLQNPTSGAAPNPPDPYTVCGGNSMAAPGFSGNLVSLRLPTLGTLEWDYSRYGFPAEGAVSHQRMDKDPEATSVSRTPLQYSVGVRERRERAADGTVLGKRTYVGRYYKLGTNDSSYALLTTMKTWSGFNTAGEGGSVFARNVSYFSVGQSGAGIARTGEYSLPFTRYPFAGASGNVDPEAAASSANDRYTEADPVVAVPNPDPQDANRFISNKVYDENGKLAQYTYVKYEGDDPDMAQGQQGDRREKGRRTVWNNGNNLFANDSVTVSSDFDGVGHYRTSVESGAGYAATTSRTSTTAYNRADADVGGNLFDTGTFDPAVPSSTAFHMLYEGAGPVFTPAGAPTPWVLGLSSSQTISEGTASAKMLTCFDQRTGFLDRKRTMIGSSPSSADLVAAFTSDHGNVVEEKYYGGDSGQYYGGQRPGVSTSALCSASLPTAEYFIAHGFDYGTQARSWYLNQSAQTAAPFWAQNDVIDPTGLVATSSDRSDLATTYSYDLMGRLVQANPPGQVAVLYTYTNATSGSPAKVNIRRDDGGANKPEFEFQFDSFGRILLERERTATNTFAERSTHYDALGRKSFVSEWGSPAPIKGTSTLYDVFGRPKTITAADSKVTSLAYTGTNTIVRSVPIRTNLNTAETLAATTESYDLLQRLVGVREPSGAFGAAVDTKYGYDVGSRLTSVKTYVSGATPDQTRTFTYDNRGLLLSAVSPEKSSAVLYRGYDARGHATQIIDGGNDLTYIYDPWERLTTIKDTGGSEIKSFVFGGANLPTGCTTACTNFLRGKLVSATRRQSDPVLGGEVTVTETYDYARSSGQVSDRKTTVSSTASFTGATFNTYQDYNPLGALQIIGYPKCLAPAPCAAATPARDSDAAYYSYANGWMTFVGSNSPAYASMTYHPSGIVKTVSHANGIDETTAADPNGMARPCAIFATGKGSQLVDDASAPCGKSISGASGVQWSTGSYAYDGAGNIRQIGSRQYVYDGVSRLVSETDSNDSPTASYRYTTDYKYDPFGNMTEQALSRQAVSKTPGGDGTVTRARTPIAVDAATNRLVAGAYDAAGNMTASGNDVSDGSLYAWDSIGTMRSLSENVRELHFLYTADDERVATVSLATSDPASKSATTWTLRGLGNQVLRTITDDQTSGSHVWSWTGDEIYRGSSLLADVTPTGTRHFVLDHLGSPRLITDGSATGNPLTNEFSAFGIGGTTGSGPLQFTGHERDFGREGARTLDYMHARYYSASVGRFSSVDPNWDSADVKLPQAWNRYSYVRNNPVGRTDPTGTVDVASVPEYLFGVISAFGTDLVGGYARPRPTSDAMAAGQLAGDLIAVTAGSHETVSGAGTALAGAGLTAGTGGAAGAISIPAIIIGTAVAAHGVSVSATGAAHLIQAGVQMSSVNQMNKEIGRGQAPSQVKRVDNGKVPNEQDHVHFNDKNDSALNRDGTWKHGFAELKRATLDWLQSHGWTLP